jgi:hypothetical protein
MIGVYSVAASYLIQIRKDLGVPEWKPAAPESKPDVAQRKRDHAR